jgi:Na+-translocating ferredoxin:NAD+ oxidoreductase RnfC subunit
VGDTFHEIVNDEDMDVFIHFHVTDCYSCKSLNLKKCIEIKLCSIYVFLRYPDIFFVKNQKNKILNNTQVN